MYDRFNFVQNFLLAFIIMLSVCGLGICGYLWASGSLNQIATKSFGGTMTYTLDSNKQLVNCTWKEHNLWLLTTDRPTNTPPKTYQLSEKSVAGVLQGTVIIQEQ